MTTPTRNASELADEISGILRDFDPFNPDMRAAASSYIEACEAAFKMLPRIAAALRTPPTVTEEAVEADEAVVERVARGLAASDRCSPWWRITPIAKGQYLVYARAAIAALSAPVSTVDEKGATVGEEHEAVRNAIWKWTGCSDQAADKAADAVLTALEVIGSDLRSPGIREAVLEEAARVAERCADQGSLFDGRAMCWHVAAAIRALKSPTTADQGGEAAK